MNALHRKAVPLTLAAGLALCHPGAAAGSTGIEEILAGAYGRPEIQHVELAVEDCRNARWDLAYVSFFDAEDRLTAEFRIPSAPSPCGGSQSVLIGTQAFADLTSAPDPDFLMPPLLDAGSGKVCLEGLGIPKCMSYGSFEGYLFQDAPADFNAPALPTRNVCSLRRGGLTRTNADFDLLPPAPANARGQTGTVTVPPRFRDVPEMSPFQPFVEALFNAGVSGGCGGGNFCPGAAITREQMAVFLLRAAEGSGFQPPPCTAPSFGDVPCSNPFAPWINEVAARGITGGCGGGNFCPGAAVTREQMAVFLLLGVEGPGYSPPACAAAAFADVPCNSPFAPWVNELAARGITGGCGGGNFCPGNGVTREQIAVFLATAFALPVPARGCPPPTDDHGDTPATATPVVPTPTAEGTIVPGVLERPRDVEVFSFPAQTGERFDLHPVATAPGLGLRVLDCATGVALTGGNPGLSFTAPRSGNFCLEARESTGRVVGAYGLRLRGPFGDDHLAPGTPLTIDGPAVAGAWEVSRDNDLFTVTTAGPQVLEVVLETDILGAQLALFGERSLDRDAAYFFVSSARTVTLSAWGGPGLYRVRVRSVPEAAGTSVATATPLQSGIPVSGTLGQLHPAVFRFEAALGDIVALHVEHGGDSRARLFRQVNGAEVLVAEPHGTGNQPVVFVAEQPGPYYLRLDGASWFTESVLYHVLFVGPLSDDHGDDRPGATPLVVGGSEATGYLGRAGGADVDVFSISAAPGNLLEVSLTGLQPFFQGGVGVRDGSGAWIPTVSEHSWTPKPQLFYASATPPYTLHISGGSSAAGPYRLSVRVIDPEHETGSLPSSAVPIVPGAPPLHARVHHRNDQDWYSFTAAEGDLFLLKLVGADWSSSLDLRVLAENGTTVLSEWFPVSTERATYQTFQAPHTGTFLVQVREGLDLYEYELSLSAPIADDHLPWLPPALTVDGPAIAGDLSFWYDRDSFTLDLAAHQTVTIEVAAEEEGHDTVVYILSPDRLTSVENDDGAGGFVPRLTFTAPAAGRYLVVVRTGTFTTRRDRYQVSVRTP
jgi:hypothetical protein